MNQLFAIYDILSNGYTIEYLDILSVIESQRGISRCCYTENTIPWSADWAASLCA